MKHILFLILFLHYGFICEATLPRWTTCNREYTERESTGLMRGIVITDTKEIVGNISCYEDKIIVVYYDDEGHMWEYSYKLANIKPLIKTDKQGIKYEQYKAKIKDSSTNEDIDCTIQFCAEKKLFLFIFSNPHELFQYYSE